MVTLVSRQESPRLTRKRNRTNFPGLSRWEIDPDYLLEEDPQFYALEQLPESFLNKLHV